jgi:hypothetical protein
VSKSFIAVSNAILAIVLVCAPAKAAPAGAASSPLGFVVGVENSNVAGGASMGGATIYDGDRLRTQEHETMRVRIGGGQILLRQNTAADVHALPNGFSASLASGTVVASSAAGQTFQIVADGVTIRPANAQAASGQIAMIGAKELVLTGIHGTLEVNMGGELKTVEAGSSYRLEVESEESGPDGQVPVGAARKHRHYLLYVVPTVAVVASLVIWRALVSPCLP